MSEEELKAELTKLEQTKAEAFQKELNEFMEGLKTKYGFVIVARAELAIQKV